VHELSICRGIVSAVERHADGRQVAAVHLRVGRLREVVPDSLLFYFGFVAKGTVCEGAELVVETVPATLECADCGRRWQLAEPLFRCPSCSSAKVAVVAGNELQVESIEIEEEDEACTAPQ
jgi:hydrogenase nickel incorporation protein HypA/HybF